MGTKGTFFKSFTKQTLFDSSYIDDCSRKVAVNKWCNRRNSEEKLLSVLKEWIELHGKPIKVMHDEVVANLHLLNSKIIVHSME
jgi:hypothetical protein